MSTTPKHWQRALEVLRAEAQSGVAPDELSAIHDRLMQEIRRAPTGVRRATAPRARPWARPLVWSPAAIAATVLIAVTFGPEEWRRRGHHEALTVEAFCSLPQGGFRAIDADPGPDEVASCPLGQPILLAYTSDAPGVLYIKVDGEWVTPVDAPIPIAATARATRLPLDLSAAPRLQVELYRVAAPLQRFDLMEPEASVRRDLSFSDPGP